MTKEIKEILRLRTSLTKQMDLGNVPINIYIDLSKPFDTFDNSILLDKLSYYGRPICGVENLMLRNYLWKTKYMVFHTPQERVIYIYPTLKINNANIESVSQFNFLGVVLASTLKWDKHIGHVSLKVSRVFGVLFRLIHIYPQEVLLTLYNTLIIPYYKLLHSGMGLQNSK